MSRVITLMVAVLLAGQAVEARSQALKKPAVTKSTHAEKPSIKGPTYATSPVDQTVETLGANYTGHSCRAVTTALLAAKPVKDEYETTAAFNERISALSGKPLYSNVALGDVLGFIPAEAYVGSKYNADAETLEISGRDRSSNAMIGKSLQQTLIVDSKLTSQGQYAASNAYGKSVNVMKTEHDVCAIAVTNIPSFEDPIRFQASVPMTPEEAQAAKGNITMLYVGTLTAPYWGKYFHATTAKITSPFEDTSTGDGLFMKVKEVWLFNKVTGRIYQKVPI